MIYRDAAGLQDDFTLAVARRAQEQPYAVALLAVKYEQPALWEAHERFRLAQAGDPSQLNAAQAREWQRFTKAERLAERFAADGADVPASVAAAVSATDGLTSDERAALLDVLAGVLHGGAPVHQAGRAPVTPAVKALVNGDMRNMGRSELEMVSAYLAALIHGSPLRGTESAEVKALHSLAHSRRLAARLSQMAQGA